MGLAPLVDRLNLALQLNDLGSLIFLFLLQQLDLFLKVCFAMLSLQLFTHGESHGAIIKAIKLVIRCPTYLW